MSLPASGTRMKPGARRRGSVVPTGNLCPTSGSSTKVQPAPPPSTGFCILSTQTSGLHLNRLSSLAIKSITLYCSPQSARLFKNTPYWKSPNWKYHRVDHCSPAPAGLLLVAWKRGDRPKTPWGGWTPDASEGEPLPGLALFLSGLAHAACFPCSPREKPPLSDPLWSLFIGLTIVPCPGGFLVSGQGPRILVSQIPCGCANPPPNLSPTLGALVSAAGLDCSPRPFSAAVPGQPKPASTHWDKLFDPHKKPSDLAPSAPNPHTHSPKPWSYRCQKVCLI